MRVRVSVFALCECVCMCVSVCVCVCACMCECVRLHVYVYVHACVCVCQWVGFGGPQSRGWKYLGLAPHKWSYISIGVRGRGVAGIKETSSAPVL